MWWKKFKGRKAQSVIIFITILLSSLMIAVAASMYQQSTNIVDNYFKDATGADVVITLPPIGNKEEIKKVEKYIKNKKEVNEVFSIKTYSLDGKAYYNDKVIKTQMFGVSDEIAFNKEKWMFREGSKKEKLAYGEIAVPIALLDDLGIDINDNLEFDIGGKRQSFKVVSAYSDPYNSSLAMGPMQIFFSDADMSEYIGKLDEGDLLRVYLNDENDIKKFLKDYRNTKEELIGGMAFDRGEIKDILTKTFSMLSAFIAIFGVIILILSIVIVRFNIWNSILKDYRSIGTYKALGFSNKEIILIYLKYYGAITLLAAIVGTIPSSFISKTLLRSNASMLGVDISGNSNIVANILVIIFIMLYVTLMFYLIIRRIKNISPIEAITLNMSKSTQNQKQSDLKGTGVFYLGFRNITVNKKRSIGLAVLLTTCIFFILCTLSNITTLLAMDKNNYYWFGFDKSDVIMEKTNLGNEKELLDKLESDNRINKISKMSLHEKSISIKENDFQDILLSIVYDDFNNIELPTIRGENPKNEYEISISEGMVKRINKDIGDYVDIFINGKRENVLIVGTFQTMGGSGNSIRVCESLVKKHNKDYSATQLSIVIKDKEDVSKFIDDYKNNDYSVIVSDREDYLKEIYTPVISPMLNALIPLTVMILLVIGINLYNIISLNISINRKALALKKALGFTFKEISLENLIYVLILTAISTVIGFLMFKFGFQKLYNLVFMNFGIYDYPIVINYALIFLTIIIIFIFVGICSYLAVREIKKVKIQELSEE